MLSNQPSYAQWVVFEKNSQLELTVYVDPNTIRRTGDLVTMWSLLDYMTIQTDSEGTYLSTKQQGEYDCAEERMRFHALTSFSDNMGSGMVVYLNPTEGNWVPVAPDSSGHALWKLACGKK